MDPARASVIWNKACENELLSWRSPAAIKTGLVAQNAVEPLSYYRIPYAGEPVTISGMRRRPDLNGAQGEIVSSKLDQHGRVLVKIFDRAEDGKAYCKTMKIEPNRLVPCASAPSLLTAGGKAGGGSAMDEDRCSVRSISRAGSCVSLGNGSRASRGSRGGSQALSSAGRNALRPASGNGVPTSGTGWLHLQARRGQDSQLFDSPVMGKIGVDLSLKERALPPLSEEA